MQALQPALDRQTMTGLVAALEAVKVPVGPIQTVAQALTSDQAVAREAVITMETPVAGGEALKLLGNPLKFSRTPVRYRRPPPRLGADTEEVLDDLDR